MARRLGICFLLLTVLAFAASCAKYGEPGPGEKKSVILRLTEPDAIPANWGKLVAVSSNSGAEDWVQLWFEDDAGNIHMARYNVMDRYLSMQAIAFRRN
jgi:hypothetical protein